MNTKESPMFDDEGREQLYYKICLIRRFEERLLELLSEGQLMGTTHACIGQEANAVAVIGHLGENDIVVSNHRCHGHYIEYTGDLTGLMAEVMGKSDGVCAGRGGSQHLCNGNFYTNGVLGSTVPIAAGMAYAEKIKATDAITVLFMGDGAFGEGIVYEAFNLISLLRLPILIVIENNRYAQTTPIKVNLAGGLLERAKAFNLKAGEIDSSDVEELYDRFNRIIKEVRKSKSPHVEIIHTHRICAHSKGDDCRSLEEIEIAKSCDPMSIIGKRISDLRIKEIEHKVCQIIDEAESKARAMDFPNIAED